MKTVCILVLASGVGCAFIQPVSTAEAITFKEKVLHSFSGGGADGANPAAGVINVMGMLYGTTVYGSGDGLRGTVFAVNRRTGAETVVYSFCSRPGCKDGFNPWGGLTNVKSTLYGTTYQGGSGFDGQQFGTAFALDPKTGKEKVLYSFCSKLINGACTDGEYPGTSLIDVNGTLYGTTAGGGTASYGAVFALDPKSGAETVLHSFCSQEKCTDGAEPEAALIDVNGTLYGTSVVGGSSDCTSNYPPACGTVFSLDPTIGTETVLYSFCSQANCADGKYPHASLIAVDGLLYGTTGYGGRTGCFAGFGCGTVFSLDPSTGAEKVLYAFCSQANCADGAAPSASLIEMNGTLYGTTTVGGGTGCGGAGCGTAFALDPKTGTETMLHSFCSQENCIDGATPQAGLIAVHGTLYGTTYAGGAYGYGTVFVLKQKR